MGKIKSELKLCPFCGRKPSMSITICDTKIQCPCGANFLVRNPKEGNSSPIVKALWNTRTEKITEAGK